MVEEVFSFSSRVKETYKVNMSGQDGDVTDRQDGEVVYGQTRVVLSGQDVGAENVLGAGSHQLESVGDRGDESGEDWKIVGNKARIKKKFSDLTRPTKIREQSEIECFNCKEKGHFKKDCQNPRIIDCYRCGQHGHVASSCEKEMGGESRVPQFRRATYMEAVLGGKSKPTATKPGINIGKVGSA